MAEFDTKGKDGLTDKTLIIDKDGSLETSNEYGQISPYPNSYRLGNLQYVFKISKIRGIIYFSEGFCTLKTYKNWHDALYKAGYAETLLVESNRHLAIRELETVDR